MSAQPFVLEVVNPIFPTSAELVMKGGEPVGNLVQAVTSVEYKTSTDPDVYEAWTGTWSQPLNMPVINIFGMIVNTTYTFKVTVTEGETTESNTIVLTTSPYSLSIEDVTSTGVTLQVNGTSYAGDPAATVDVSSGVDGFISTTSILQDGSQITINNLPESSICQFKVTIGTNAVISQLVNLDNFTLSLASASQTYVDINMNLTGYTTPPTIDDLQVDGTSIIEDTALYTITGNTVRFNILDWDTSYAFTVVADGLSRDITASTLYPTFDLMVTPGVQSISFEMSNIIVDGQESGTPPLTSITNNGQTVEYTIDTSTTPSTYTITNASGGFVDIESNPVPSLEPNTSYTFVLNFVDANTYTRTFTRSTLAPTFSIAAAADISYNQVILTLEPAIYDPPITFDVNGVNVNNASWNDYTFNQEANTLRIYGLTAGTEYTFIVTSNHGVQVTSNPYTTLSPIFTVTAVDVSYGEATLTLNPIGYSVGEILDISSVSIGSYSIDFSYNTGTRKLHIPVLTRGATTSLTILSTGGYTLSGYEVTTLTPTFDISSGYDVSYNQISLYIIPVGYGNTPFSISSISPTPPENGTELSGNKLTLSNLSAGTPYRFTITSEPYNIERTAESITTTPAVFTVDVTDVSYNEVNLLQVPVGNLGQALNITDVSANGVAATFQQDTDDLLKLRISNLIAGTPYTFGFKADNGATATASASTTPPVINLTQNQGQVSYNTVTLTAEYIGYLGQYPDVSSALVNGVSKTFNDTDPLSIVISGLNPNGSYNITVKFRDGNQASVTGAITLPPDFTLEVADLSSNYVDLSMNLLGYLSTPAVTSVKKDSVTLDPSKYIVIGEDIRILDLSAGATYAFDVYTADASASIINVKTLSPFTLSFVSKDFNSVTMSLNLLPGAVALPTITSVKKNPGNTSYSTATSSLNVGTTTLTITGLTDGQEYDFEVIGDGFVRTLNDIMLPGRTFSIGSATDISYNSVTLVMDLSGYSTMPPVTSVLVNDISSTFFDQSEDLSGTRIYMTKLKAGTTTKFTVIADGKTKTLLGVNTTPPQFTLSGPATGNITDGSIRLLMSDYVGILENETPIVSAVDLSGTPGTFYQELNSPYVTITGLSRGTTYRNLGVTAQKTRKAVAGPVKTWVAYDGMYSTSGYTPEAYTNEYSFTTYPFNDVSGGSTITATIMYSNDISGGRIIFKNLVVPSTAYEPQDLSGNFIIAPSNNDVTKFILLDCSGAATIKLRPHSYNAESKAGSIDIDYEGAGAFDTSASTNGTEIYTANFFNNPGILQVSGDAVYNDATFNVFGAVRDELSATTLAGVSIGTIPLRYVNGSSATWSHDISGWVYEVSGYKVNFLLGQLETAKVHVSYVDASDTVYSVIPSNVTSDEFVETYDTTFTLVPNRSLNYSTDLSTNDYPGLTYKYNAVTLVKDASGAYRRANGSAFNLVDVSGVVASLGYTSVYHEHIPIQHTYRVGYNQPPAYYIDVQYNEALVSRGYTVSLEDPAGTLNIITDISGRIYQDPSGVNFLSEFAECVLTDPSGSVVPVPINNGGLDISANVALTLRQDFGTGRYYLQVTGSPTAAGPVTDGRSFPTPAYSIYVPGADETDAPTNPLIGTGYTLIWDEVEGVFVAPPGKNLSSAFRFIMYMTDIPGQLTARRVYNLVTVAGGLAFPCFLGDAPVLTPGGWRRIDSLLAGDDVVTATGAVVPVRSVSVTQMAATAATRPYVIAEGQFGANQRLPISPRHRVAVGGRMIEAQELGLPRDESVTGTILYYNVELPAWENMIVAGVEVESQAPLKHVIVSAAQFHAMFAAKYGALTPALEASIRRSVRFLPDGRVECTVAPRHQGVQKSKTA